MIYHNTENDIEVATIPMKSGVKALEQSTVGSVTPGRFNPYLASPEDPFRAKQLLLNDKFRVLWLELAPQCIFTMRIYTPSTVISCLEILCNFNQIKLLDNSYIFNNC